MSEIKVYPASMSASGNNAHYLKGCEIVQHSPSYAACLFKISELDAGRVYPGKESCVEAIKSRKCRAAEMKQEEELAGKAIYFFERKFIQNAVITNLTPADQIPKGNSWSSPTPVARSEKKEAPTEQDKEFDAEDGFAAAINAEMQNLSNAETQKPAFTESKPVLPPPSVRAIEIKQEPKAGPLAMLPGETPLQYARRSAIYRKSIQQQGQPA